MASQTTPYVLPPSPVMTLPYDVLERLFLLCLPENPLDEVQPNTQIAPMLLCHICSSWRSAALEIPALWTHLNFRPHIIWTDETPIASNPGLLVNDMEFLEWWRKNQRGSLIRFQFRGWEEGRGFHPLPSLIIDIFVHFVSSARYLDVDPLTAYLFRRDKGIEFSQLESLVTSHPYGPSEDFDSPPELLLLNVPSTLRHLCLHDVSVPQDFINAFASWSKLTHLSLHNMYVLSQEVWYSLIRSVPNLQWGYFAISFPFLASDDPTLPTFILPFLSTLSVVFPNFDFTYQLLLLNLRFPVLHDLSIYTDIYPSNVVQLSRKINGVLRCAPAVTKLTLGFRLNLIDDHEPIQTLHWDGVEKLSEAVPHLTHLVLGMRSNPVPHLGLGRSELSKILEIWEQVLRGEHWVDVHNPSSAIRKITAVVKTPSAHSPLVKEAIVRALELDQEKNARNVAVEVVGEDKQGFAPNSDRWKTWGMSL